MWPSHNIWTLPHYRCGSHRDTNDNVRVFIALSHLVLTLHTNVKTKREFFSNFCGLLKISELYPTTGVVLIVTLTIMFVCSLPFVRRSGHFEYFYFSHLLYSVYFVAIILHAQHVWKWICVPLGLFLIEKTYLK